MSEDPLDQLLKRHFARETSDDARVLAKLAGPLPRQKQPTRWPQFLLNLQFAPAWPRVAALASCAVFGFIVGSTTIDRIVSTRANTDLALVAFEPEPLTGL